MPSAWRAPIRAIEVVPDVLYVDEGNLLTAAGSAAGIDLSLHLIRRDWGAAAANSVARRLVVPPHRDGGQAQFIEAPVPEAREGGRLGPLLERMRAEPAARDRLAALAQRGRHEPPHVPAPLQGQHGHDARRLAARRARGACARVAGVVARRHRGDCGHGRVRLRRHPAPPLPQADEVKPADYRRQFGMEAARGPMHATRGLD